MTTDKMNRSKAIALNIVAGILLLGPALRAQVLTSSVSSYSYSLDANALSTPNEAGADLNSTLETSSNFNQLSLHNLAKSQQWKVAVSRQDINWPAGFSISVIRTSDGTPCSGCTGVNTASSPASYVPLTALETDFIYGSGSVSNIDVQIKVEGISLTVDAQAYSTEIIYTLYGD